MSIDDGGEIFPRERVVAFDVRGDGSAPRVTTQTAPGMSLRDYFAAKAMAALLTSGVAAPRYEPDDPEQAHSLAYLAYKVADAMLAQGKSG